MLACDVPCTVRHVDSACIWISRVHALTPKDPSPLERLDDPPPPPPAGAAGAGVDPPPPPAPPPAGGGAGAGDAPMDPGDVVPPNPPPEASPLEHSRSPIVRSAIRFRLVMSRASARLPYSHPLTGRPIPVTRIRPSRTRSCAQVNVIFGPTGISKSAERSAKVKREKNAAAELATRRVLPSSSVF